MLDRLLSDTNLVLLDISIEIIILSKISLKTLKL
jgi:hypothetical protein